VGTPLPPRPEEAIFISSGTWSLVGVELPHPVATEAALRLNLSNEHGVSGTTRLLRNVMGLWLLQRCEAEWARGATGGRAAMLDSAAAAAGFGPLVDPDDAGFLNPPSMTRALDAFYTRTGQAAPADPGTITRSILESLALRYRWCIEAIATVAGTAPGVVHIVGGGSQNRLLCQLTADATGLPVVAGPVEATAAGNIIVQAVADGALASVAEGRVLVRAGDLRSFEPRPDERWDAAYARFRQLVAGPAAAGGA
jgi:rhamnulokinase